MDRISVRALATAIRLIREPVVVTYSYPRSHPLYGAGEECGVFVPMAEWTKITDVLGHDFADTALRMKIADDQAAVEIKT